MKIKFFRWSIIILAEITLLEIFKNNETLKIISSNVILWRNKMFAPILADISFSVGDVLYVLFGMFLIWKIILWLKTKSSIQILPVLKIFAFIIPCYYLLWGIQYQKRYYPVPKIISYFNSEEVYQAAESVIQRTNALKLRLSKTDKISKTDVIHSLQNAYPGKTVYIKSSLFSPLMSYTGISGYYNPFTGEAQYNPNPPKYSYCFTIAHEIGHQLGMTKEYECNFFAYQTLRNSGEVSLCYAAELFALKSLLSVNKLLPKKYEALKKQILPSVWADLIEERIFYENYDGIFTKVFRTTNDWFLKMNGEAGQISYSVSALMILEQEVNKKEAAILQPLGSEDGN